MAMKKETVKQARLVYLLGLLLSTTAVAPVWGADPAKERQALTNPDFALPLAGGNPPGWFRAMMPKLTTGLEAEVARDEAGPYLFLKQAGVQGQLFNNWAQRLEGPPIGAKVRLETQVAVRNAQGKGAVVLVMFFDKAGKVVGAVSSEGRYDLTGTKDFTVVRLETTVPPDSSLAIVRLGLSAAAGEILVRHARLYLAGGMQGPSAAAVSTPSMPEGRQALTNPDFALPLAGGNPPGWFRAMMPKLTTGLEAGVARDEAGPYLFLKQAGVQGQLFNNWAQRLEGPPIGAKVRLETQVAVRDAQGKGAVVLVMFFDKAGKIVGGASSEGRYDLTGTKGWTAVRLEATVPPDSDLAIVRLGLSPAAGEIQVRYARLYLAGGAQGPSAAVRTKEKQQ
jgi:uncharacterized protein YrrD